MASYTWKAAEYYMFEYVHQNHNWWISSSDHVTATLQHIVLMFFFLFEQDKNLNSDQLSSIFTSVSIRCYSSDACCISWVDVKCFMMQ